jgi:hypothetical protein
MDPPLVVRLANGCLAFSTVKLESYERVGEGGCIRIEYIEGSRKMD